MTCPKCGAELSFSNRICYNDEEICVKCAYDEAPEGSPVRTQLSRNYPELIRKE